ncbi:hypothetical protein D3C81_2069430 [compost metagenome]
MRSLDAGAEAEGDVRETIFEVNNPKLAHELIGEGRIEKGCLIIAADRDTTSQINVKLVNAGIAVYSIRAVTRSLEDQFLELTGGGQID